ncbi:response regulator [Photobacterium atrarenae]|uniref:Response regulator transcription factor n=1 Tax=Photobacterium atrarenae TaxID=865757 RepID=A0ABY5GN96_9GAMM|nr:response regulator transcription factor [Photobacterium atrarenae]UTV30280.1 response regulator transcription factor [Photobacterium atrarenae]
MTPYTILIIDDEPQIQTFIRIALSAEGFQSVSATNVAEAQAQINTAAPDLIILDLGLPDGDGSDLLQRLRRDQPTPVLVLTARDEEDEKVRLLELGANDYLSKPFGIRELMARIKVLLRDLIPAEKPANKLVFEQMTLDIERHEVLLNHQPISLSKKEFALLSTLARHAGELVKQDHLLRDIWGETHQDDTHYLRIFISQLRRKLNDDADQPRFIKTEPGIGYRFLPELIHRE